MLPKAVTGYLEAYREEHLAKLEQLLRFPSVANSRAQDCRRCAEWLAAHLEALGLTVRMVEGGGPPNVLAEARIGLGSQGGDKLEFGMPGGQLDHPRAGLSGCTCDGQADHGFAPFEVSSNTRQISSRSSATLMGRLARAPVGVCGSGHCTALVSMPV